MNAVGLYFDHVSNYTAKPYPGTACIIPVLGNYNYLIKHHLLYEVSFEL